MRREHVRDLLRQVADGSLDVAHALDALAVEPTESLGFATIDHHRALRQGFPEVVYGAGKTPEQIREIAARIIARGDGVLVTRIADDAAALLASSMPSVDLNSLARTAFVRGETPAPRGTGTVAVVTAGTSDLPVAEEAAVTLDALGDCVMRVTDVGVAGIHRVLAKHKELMSAAGVTVVNIDNGFGAAVAASRITHAAEGVEKH
jgi:pyridinium-3,5-biscarboxylic acid mononucleotide synthase